MMDKITFTGLNDLETDMQDVVKNLALKNFEKLSQMVENMESIAVHVKPIQKSGHTSQYTIKLRLISPGKTCEAEKTEFDLVKAVNVAFSALINEVKI